METDLSFSVLFHREARVCLKYFVHGFSIGKVVIIEGRLGARL